MLIHHNTDFATFKEVPIELEIKKLFLMNLMKSQTWTKLDK